MNILLKICGSDITMSAGQIKRDVRAMDNESKLRKVKTELDKIKRDVRGDYEEWYDQYIYCVKNIQKIVDGAL